MIKIVACDIDGTMLLNGEKTVPKRLIDNIERLLDKGIIFAPASGRQYPTMRRMFGDRADELMYICENGALVVYKGHILSKSVMDRAVVLDIVEDILGMPNCEVLLSGKDISYMQPKTRAYFDRIHDKIKNNIHIVNDFSKLDDDFIKLACCDLSGIVNSKDHFIEKWSDKVQVAVSGELYIDFTKTGVNKGNALTEVMKQLNISSEEAMAFGDSYNDVEMLKCVKHSYAMSHTFDDIKAVANGIAVTVSDVLEDVLLNE